ncbi:MAG TPA: AAA family ATPase [Candidatus Brocadiia bacterium]|nr:AAA family ATPase [Candidatus Brocadiales bacterium]
MKILKLEIEKIRGIKNLSLEPKGKSIVIFGPNGSGKSAIVDAIDFLLTGKISRLEGEGTEALSTRKHGPHVDHDVKEAIVKARVEIPGISDPIDLERRMSNPSKLIYEKKFETQMSPILNVSSLGLHKLSRREILKYIMATAGTRASEIHGLLDLEEIDKIRKSLVSFKNSLDKEKSYAVEYFGKTKLDIKIILNLETFSEEECLAKINEHRGILKVKALEKLNTKDLKRDISQPGGKGEEDVKNLDYLKHCITAIKDLLKNQESILELDKNLKEKIKEFNEDVELCKEIAHKKLVELGLSLIDDKNVCPLCEKPWDTGELKNFLSRRLSESTKGSKKVEEIKSLAVQVRTISVNYKNIIENINSYYQSLGLQAFQDRVATINKQLSDINDKLLSPLELYSKNDTIFENLFAKGDLGGIIEKIEQEISSLKYQVSPELSSWTTLTKLEVLLGQYDEAYLKFEKAEKLANQANLILGYFEKARDETLQSIYDKINEDFSCLYSDLHGDDEKDFKASLIPKEAELLFEVDFYGRGKFHPGAVHSEGHQDSMGLCLFLSLHKFLTQRKLALVVLDDVVMSIDGNHRRNICRALSKHFPDKQFIITTHDTVWANQLKTEGIVNAENMVEFKWWSIETGPATGIGEDFWQSIIEDVDKNSVPQAAWKLRRNGECFLSAVCDSMRANVIFKSDGSWELGDYLPAAIGQYKNLLSKAKDAANSWGNKGKIEELNGFDQELKEAITSSQCEQWAINKAVHYNKWTEFQPNDFRPVVDAFQKLFQLFTCKDCKNIPRLLIAQDRKLEAVKCLCGKINWNLRSK